mgnify:CR=1 FL=1
MSKGKIIVTCLRIFLILFLACSEIPAFAQAKPKRDKSKDYKNKVVNKAKPNKNVVVKTPKTSITLNSKVHKSESVHKKDYHLRRSKRRYTRRKYVNRKATYLTVDGSINPEKEYLYASGSYKFPVRTDGKDWYIVNIYPWCQAYKESQNELILYIGQNESNKERRSRFNVVCDNQSVTVEITQQGKPIYAKATINNVDISHNLDNLWILANVTVSGASSLHCYVIGYVRDEYGTLLRDQNGYGGLLSFISEFVPPSDEPYTQTLTMYLPKYKLPLIKGKHRYTLDFNIYCTEIQKTINSYPYKINFYVKVKKHKITTFGSEHLE